jgi:hypothetical protein
MVSHDHLGWPTHTNDPPTFPVRFTRQPALDLVERECVFSRWLAHFHFDHGRITNTLDPRILSETPNTANHWLDSASISTVCRIPRTSIKDTAQTGTPHDRTSYHQDSPSLRPPPKCPLPFPGGGTVHTTAGPHQIFLNRWRVPLDRFLKFTVSHELGHALCRERDEARVIHLAEELRISGTVSCERATGPQSRLDSAAPKAAAGPSRMEMTAALATFAASARQPSR